MEKCLGLKIISQNFQDEIEKQLNTKIVITKNLMLLLYLNQSGSFYLIRYEFELTQVRLLTIIKGALP